MSEQSELVADERNSSVPLRALAYAQLAHFGSQISIDGESLPVGNHFAQSFALILHELATNAAKYGALSAQQGTVTLAWSVVFTAKGRHLKLSWTERGGPTPSTDSPRGFGTTLVTRQLEGPLGGEAAFDFRSEGLTVRLDLPIDGVGVSPVKPAEADV